MVMEAGSPVLVPLLVVMALGAEASAETEASVHVMNLNEPDSSSQTTPQ